MLIGIKTGSATLVNAMGSIKDDYLIELVRQVAELVKMGHQVFIVTSGAVASDPERNRSKNLRSGVGQPRLMSRYSRFFEIYGIEVSQHLLIDRDVLKKGSEITKVTLLEAFANGIVPIINGNDVVDNKELKALEVCADNDQLFKSVCLLIKADVAIICFDGEGLLDENQNVIHEVGCKKIETIFPLIKKSCGIGHGDNGMLVKVNVLAELASSGLASILVSGRKKNFILRAFRQEKKFGTRFIK
jgi:glutamate 5-kinase